jgi:hypothetical protein
MVVSYVRDRERIFLRWPQGDLRDTVTNPDYVTVDASRDRLHLADWAPLGGSLSQRGAK